MGRIKSNKVLVGLAMVVYLITYVLWLTNVLSEKVHFVFHISNILTDSYLQRWKKQVGLLFEKLKLL